MREDICPPLLATLLVLNEVWALGTYEYFQAFPVVLEKIFLTFSKCFHMCVHKSFAYYQPHRDKSKFSRVIFVKRNKLNCGDLTISCLHDTTVQFSELVWSICVWHLKLCISFV